jgi:PKD domain
MTHAKKTFTTWALAALGATAAVAPLATSAQVWTASTPGSVGAMLALDRDNNTYVAGSTATAGLLTKYSPTGALLWQLPITDLTGRLAFSWITVDPGGNPVVAGRMLDASGLPIGPWLARYSPAGVRLNTDMITSLPGYATRVATDTAGNMVLVGNAQLANASGITTAEVVAMKLQPNGLRQWARSFGVDATSNEYANALAITPAGTAVIAGGSNGQMMLTAIDATGNTVWTKVIPGVAEAMDVVVGSQGEIYAVGRSATGGAGSGYVVVKHDASFNELWRIAYPARGGALRAALDAAGNLFVTGAVDTNTGLAQVILYDWMTLKLDPNGAVLWSRQYGQPQSNNDVPSAIAVGADGSVTITGEGRTASTDPQPNVRSTATLKYTADGTQLWLANTAASTRGIGVKLGSDGDAYVLGESPQTVTRYPQSGSTNQPPTALASASTSAGPAPLTVTFSSAGSADADGSIASTVWTFGDGQTSALANPAHTYAAGSFTAQLTVTDNLGATATSAPIVITANAVAPPPTPKSLTLTSPRITGGKSTRATVTVAGPSGVTVALSSSAPDVAGVPANVVIPVGATSASFTVRTTRVKRNTVVTLRASANGVAATASLTVLR